MEPASEALAHGEVADARLVLLHLIQTAALRADQEVAFRPELAQSRIGLVGRASARHHVGRHRPGGSTKSDKGRLTGKVLPQRRYLVPH
jgi:hypothetical protein